MSSQGLVQTCLQGMDRCDLLDLNFFGGKYTWQHPCRGGRLVSRRLDRAICDPWCMAFPEATVEHLVRRYLDHNPILIRCSSLVGAREDRPFRFLAAWCTHPDYPDIVRNTSRNQNGDVSLALHKVTQESMKFHKEKFGNVFANKRRLEARLLGIQRAMESIDSASLFYLQRDLLREYEEILFQEESIWFQKSREKWIRLGSRNTKFFHAQTVIRRKRNKIHGLQLPSGEWCTESTILQEEVVSFFKDLFCTKEVVRNSIYLPNICPLSDAGKNALTQSVTKAEVHRALMSMKSYKALGPDGFQPIFYKMFWEDVVDDVWRFVRDSFACGQFTEPVSEL